MNINTGPWSPNNQSPLGGIQNAYHPYEIFDFLESKNYVSIDWTPAAKSAFLCCDNVGNFSPYSGGSACYDYDALFLLSKNKYLFRKYINNKRNSSILMCLNSYNKNLFCELLLNQTSMRLKDIFLSSNSSILLERLNLILHF